jgi:hypothetical protein
MITSAWNPMRQSDNQRENHLPLANFTLLILS